MINCDNNTYVGPKVSPTLYGAKFCLEASVNVMRLGDKKEARESKGQESP